MALDLFFEFPVLLLLVKQAAESHNPSAKPPHAKPSSGFRNVVNVLWLDIPCATSVLAPKEYASIFLLEDHTYFTETSSRIVSRVSAVPFRSALKETIPISPMGM